jgi:outer membrane protein assembly factor BamB
LVAVSAARGAEPANGWRGNGTGLWPDATPPLEWFRIPRGALDGLRAGAHPPQVAEPGKAPLVAKGLLRDWLVLGPFSVADSVKDLDKDFLRGEANVQPSVGGQTAERTWQPATVPPDDIMAFGTAEMPWLDLAKILGFQRNQVAYAHTYVFSPRGGPARIVVDHAQGLKAWVNGKQVYRSPERGVALGYYTAISRHELDYLDQPSPRFDFALQKGWNRLLLKLSTSNRPGYEDMRCCLRIMDPPDVRYETKNIVWRTPLPGRSTSTPILVKDRLFVMAEPDELVCVDKSTGRLLWSAFINFYEAVTADEHRTQPAFAQRVDSLVSQLRAETDPGKRVRLRAAIHKALGGIDAARFAIRANDHFAAHFGIVGFTMPTPVSDGQHVFVWSGLGVAACFNLDGQRQWITRVKTDELSYGSSPTLADGVLVVFLNGLYGLDAKTGKLLWQQPKVRSNVGSVLGATLAGQPVVVTQRGIIVRPSDGELLYRPRDSTSPGDTGSWAPGVILGERVYQPKYGVNQLSVWDFHNAPARAWEPQGLGTIGVPEAVSHGAKGQWIDRSTAGSPLVWQGYAYQVDIYQTLFVADLKRGQTVYYQPMDLQGLMHYNAVPVAASPTLVGKRLVVLDNQGTALVLQPGPAYKVLARNHIGTQLDRRWPIPAQETLAYAPPLADGSRLYLRGEAFLYCIGER